MLFNNVLTFYGSSIGEKCIAVKQIFQLFFGQKFAVIPRLHLIFFFNLFMKY